MSAYKDSLCVVEFVRYFSLKNKLMRMMVVMMSRSLLSPFLQRQHSFHCLSFHCREIASLTVPPADSGRLHLVQFVLNNAFCSLRDAGRNV